MLTLKERVGVSLCTPVGFSRRRKKIKRTPRLISTCSAILPPPLQDQQHPWVFCAPPAFDPSRAHADFADQQPFRYQRSSGFYFRAFSIPVRTLFGYQPPSSHNPGKRSITARLCLDNGATQLKCGEREKVKRVPLRGVGVRLANSPCNDAETPVRVLILGMKLDQAARRRHENGRPPA